MADLRLRGSPTIEHCVAIGNLAVRTVIDAGANKGQFAAYASQQWPEAALHCFEPLPQPAAKLQRVLGGHGTVYVCALGAEPGEAIMHVATREDSSSLLPLGERQKRRFNMSEKALLTVPVARLDAVLKGAELARPTLLKIDVQGFELEVLHGARGLLDAVDFIYVECSLVELYEGQKTLDAVYELLHWNGFLLKGIYNSTTGRAGEVLQADFLFLRSNEGHEGSSKG